MQFNREENNNNMQNDAAFMSLLSSQRKMLQQLNQDQALRTQGLGFQQQQQQQQQLQQQHQQQQAQAYPQQQRTGYPILQDSSGLYATNYSIEQQQADQYNMVYPKRFSMGFGGGFDNQALADLLASDKITDNYQEDSSKLPPKKRGKLDDDNTGDFKQQKKRRLSSGLGYMNPSFFEESLSRRGSLLGLEGMSLQGRRGSLALALDASRFPSRRGSMLGALEAAMYPSRRGSLAAMQERLENPGSTDPANYIRDRLNQQQTKNAYDTAVLALLSEPVNQVRVDPVEMKTGIEKFTNSMDLSETSQKSIHEWDRKMGLKRSHSKTMRLSARSRKKLHAMLKKEMKLYSTR
jgi:hypothetical protein